MDDQNQEGMNDTQTPESSTEIHIENDGGSKNMIATVVIIILVLLIGFGVYTYMKRANKAPVQVDENTPAGADEGLPSGVDVNVDTTSE